MTTDYLAFFNTLWSEAVADLHLTDEHSQQRVTLSDLLTEFDKHYASTDPLFDMALFRYYDEMLLSYCFLYIFLTSKAIDDADHIDSDKFMLAGFYSVVCGITTCLSAMRHLIVFGCDIQARSIVRTVREYATLGNYLSNNHQFLREYVTGNTPERSKEFWRKHLSNQRAAKKNLELLARRLQLSEREIKVSLHRMAEENMLLSMSVHPGFYQSMRTMMADPISQSAKDADSPVLPYIRALGNRTSDSEETIRLAIWAGLEFMAFGAEKFLFDLQIDIRHATAIERRIDDTPTGVRESMLLEFVKGRSFLLKFARHFLTPDNS